MFVIIQFKFLHYKGCLIQNKRVIKILYMLHSLSSHQCWKINVQILNIIYDYIYELLQSLIDRIKYFYVMYIGYNPYCNFKLKDILSIQDECKFRLHLTARGISFSKQCKYTNYFTFLSHAKLLCRVGSFKLQWSR